MGVRGVPDRLQLNQALAPVQAKPLLLIAPPLMESERSEHLLIL